LLRDGIDIEDSVGDARGCRFLLLIYAVAYFSSFLYVFDSGSFQKTRYALLSVTT